MWSWLGDAPQALLAIDAPLGWPAAFATALARYRAGVALAGATERLFRRETDREVRRRIGRRPLEVAADRIARTAHAALALLAELRALSGRPVELAWGNPPPAGLCAIEVYPAGTLQAAGLPASGYKRSDQRAVRERILRGLAAMIDTHRVRRQLLIDADRLDAAVCVFAALDFLAGRSPPPADLELARREGWIWVRDPQSAESR